MACSSQVFGCSMNTKQTEIPLTLVTDLNAERGWDCPHQVTQQPMRGELSPARPLPLCSGNICTLPFFPSSPPPLRCAATRVETTMVGTASALVPPCSPVSPELSLLSNLEQLFPDGSRAEGSRGTWPMGKGY